MSIRRSCFELVLSAILLWSWTAAAGTLQLPLKGIRFESCSAGQAENGVLKGVVPAPAGSIYWNVSSGSLEGYDRMEFVLSGLDKRFTAASFLLAFRADGKYHYAGYAAKPVIIDGKTKLVFDISKTYRKNVIAIRLFFNRTKSIKSSCGFTVEKAELTSGSWKAPLAVMELKPELLNLESCSAGQVKNGVLKDVVPAPAGSIYWKAPLISLEKYDRAVLVLEGLDKRFTAASFLLAFRADGKYHYAGYAAKPVIVDGKAELIFNISKTYRKNVVAIRLFFNRTKSIDGPCGFTVKKACLEQSK